MLIHLNKKIELNDVTSIKLSMDENNNYTIDNLLLDPYSLKCHGIVITPTLRELLNNLVHRFVVNALKCWSFVLQIDESLSDRESVDLMERSVRRLFEHPNLYIIAIEERATHQLRMEIEEAARAFILDFYYRMSDQDREDFLNQFTDNHVLHVYYDPYNERFRFSFPDESYPGEDKDHFHCGHVVLTPEDIEEIFD